PLPRSAELIVVLQDAAGVRATAGEQLTELLMAWSGTGRAGPKWDALAKSLGWSQEEAFDRLLGQRVIVVIENLTAALDGSAAGRAGEGGREAAESPIRWALLTDVSAETDRRLVERLKAAPRALVKGQPVLSIENGRFELAAKRRKGKGANDGSPVTLIVGPAAHPEVFDTLLESAGGGGGGGGGGKGGPETTLAGTPALHALRRLGPAEAYVLLRLEQSLPVNNADRAETLQQSMWSNYATMAWAAADNRETWEARFILRDSSLMRALRDVPETSGEAFVALSDGALAAVLEHRLRLDNADGIGQDSNPVAQVLTALGLPKALQDALGQRQAVVVRPGPAPLGIALGLAVEGNDLSELARAGDAYVRGMIIGIERAIGFQSQAQPPDLAGTFPEAIRSAGVRTAGLLGDHEESSGLHVAWAYGPVVGGESVPGAPGWWVLGAAGGEGGQGGMGGSDVARQAVSDIRRTLGEAPRRDGAAKSKRWISQGMIRPAAIESALPAMLPDPIGWRKIGRSVHRVDDGFFVAPMDEVEGVVRIELAKK
ncbi:MAG: hypothetical protein H7Y88_13090, partial [Phycisphaerales bacterium]|nr:hypothetical protein [Phycisphaerales bacterium]